MGFIDSSKDIITQKTKNLNVVLTTNQTLEIKDVSRVKKPNFLQVGSGYKGIGMNYTKELLAMTPQEAFVFDLLMDNRVTPYIDKPYIRSNYSYIDNSQLTNSEKKKIYEGYKRLRAKDLIIRVSRGNYLINPELVITNDDLYQTELLHYQKLKDK